MAKKLRHRSGFRLGLVSINGVYCVPPLDLFEFFQMGPAGARSSCHSSIVAWAVRLAADWPSRHCGLYHAS